MGLDQGQQTIALKLNPAFACFCAVPKLGAVFTFFNAGGKKF